MQKMNKPEIITSNKSSRPSAQGQFKTFNEVVGHDNGNSWLEEKDKWLIPNTAETHL